MDGAQLAQLARGPFGTHAADAVACYVRDRTAAGLRTEPIDIWAAIATDRMFRIPAIRTAECCLRADAAEGGRSEDATDPGASTAKAPVWMYRFDHESPAREGRLQACHSLDIPFVWGTYALPRMQRFCGTGEVVECLSRRHGELSRFCAQRQSRERGSAGLAGIRHGRAPDHAVRGNAGSCRGTDGCRAPTLVVRDDRLEHQLKIVRQADAVLIAVVRPGDHEHDESKRSAEREDPERTNQYLAA